MSIKEWLKVADNRLKVASVEAEINWPKYLIEDILNINLNQLIQLGHIELNVEDLERLNKAVNRLCLGVPFQYVTNKAYFLEYEFYVDDSVLIPRPETEELVDWVRKDFHQNNLSSILEIGTGSGCIAISLADYFKTTKVKAIDVSEKALAVAYRNANKYNVNIEFDNVDFLDSTARPKNTWDIIVSNPPYIPTKESKEVGHSTHQHEPHLALYTDDEFGLSFYQAIAEYGKNHLNRNGSIYVELNEFSANKIEELFKASGYQTILRTDMQDKYRMLKATSTS